MQEIFYNKKNIRICQEIIIYKIGLILLIFFFAHQELFAFTKDTVNHRIQVQVGSNPTLTTTEILNALTFLANRSDKDVQWTAEFASGLYTMATQVNVTNLENVILLSDAYHPARFFKSPDWYKNSEDPNALQPPEYLFIFRMAKNVVLEGFEFHGVTDFKNNVDPVWKDQGVYFGSGNGITVQNNKFYNFGNTALRVVTDAKDPTTDESGKIIGVNSFNTTVRGNLFNNIYQTATTATDQNHGGTALALWTENTYELVRGSVKFASRTTGARGIKFTNNVIRGGDHFGLEIDNYSDFVISGNIIENIKSNAINIYTAGNGDIMKSGFAWGDSFTISGNTLKNVGDSIRFDHRPFWDGKQNIPKNLVIDGNIINGVTASNQGTPTINVQGGAFDGLRITRNKLTNISNTNYFSAPPPGSTNVLIAGNAVNGVDYGNPMPREDLATFTTQELNNPHVSGDDSDPDGDGIANLLEYALARDPKSPDASALLVLGNIQIGLDTYLTTTFTCRSKIYTPDVNTVLQISSNMMDWKTQSFPILVSKIDNGDGTLTFIYRDTVPLTFSGPRFFKLTATR